MPASRPASELRDVANRAEAVVLYPELPRAHPPEKKTCPRFPEGAQLGLGDESGRPRGGRRLTLPIASNNSTQCLKVSSGP